MAIRGRKPIPTALKVLTGNPGKRKLNKAEPVPSGAIPKCPTWLSKEAKVEWKKLAPELSRLGLLTIVDEGCLAGYCSALGEFRAACQTIDKEGRYVMVGGWAEEITDPVTGEVKVEWRGGQTQPHPAMNSMRAAWKAVKEFAALFGLEPSSRSRLSVIKGVGAVVDDVQKGGGLKAFIGGRKA